MADSTTDVTKDKLKSSRPSASSGDIPHIVITNEAGTRQVAPDALGRLPTTATVVGIATVPVSWADSVADENNRVVKGATGILYGLTGVNTGPTQYIQVHDAAALPANGAIPEIILIVNANSNFAWDCRYGKTFTNGIVVCNSTTKATKTIGAANCWFNVEYE